MTVSSLYTALLQVRSCGGRILRPVPRPVLSGALSVVLASTVLAYKAQAEAVRAGGVVADKPAVSLSATKAAFIPGATECQEDANVHGVFPVQLAWSLDGAPGITAVRIERGLLGSDVFETVAVVSAEPAFYLDRNEDALPGETYLYRIFAADSEDGSVLAETAGYGALTYIAYIDKYNESVTFSHEKMTLMHRRPNIAKLGREKAAGDISGTLSYRTKLRGFHGIVLMDYAGYSDIPGWILNGSSNTRANLAANGRMFASVRCSGMYPGVVCYDSIKIRRGAARGGFYMVEPEGFPCGEVSWDDIRAEREKILPRPQEDAEYGDAEYEEEVDK